MKALLLAAALQGAQDSVSLLSSYATFVSETAALEAADRLVEAHLPLSAGDLLSRHLSARTEQGSPNPRVLLAAARAYGEARAWTDALRLLRGQPWLEQADGGRGLLEIARAYAGLDSLSEAVDAYEAYAGRLATGEVAPPERRASFRSGFAAVLSRLGEHGAAAAQYEAAAEIEPEYADWFRLSALQQAARAGDLGRARSLAAALQDDAPVSRDSVRLELAMAAFGAGAADEGVRLARRLPSRARAALAAEWIAPARLAAGDTAAAVDALLMAVREGKDAHAGRLLLDLREDRQTLLLVAQSDVDAGRTERAVSLLNDALRTAPESEMAELRMALARAQYAARDYQQVVWTLAPWMETGQVTPEVDEAEVWFLAGRSFSRLDAPVAAEDALRRAVEAGFGGESAFASYLLADLLQDDGRLAEARAAYERTIARFPRSGWAGRSLIRLAMLSFLESDYAASKQTLDRYRRRYPGGAWYHATVYWTARSLEAAGDSSAAKALYREAVGIDPLGYYGQLAARRVGLDPFELATRAGGALEPLALQKRRLLERMERLRQLGWSHRALREHAVEMRSGRTPASQRLPFAIALSEAGWTRQGIRLGLQAHRREGARWTEAALRAVHPLPYRTAIEELSRMHDLDAALVAGLIRRESLFEADVVSSAGAVGLMQLLPRTALEMAGDAGLESLDTDQLEVPEVNLRLGTVYLAEMLSRFVGSVPAALISYNAGPHRYLRWRHFPERAVDEELFIERIPFLETRVYTKEVTSNALIYGRLYGLRRATVDGAEQGR